VVVSGIYAIDLIGWRHKVAAIYEQVRTVHEDDPRAAWELFRRERDRLYREHPCSAFAPGRRDRFEGFRYYDYDPAFCVEGEIDHTVEETSFVAHISEGALSHRRIATARFWLAGRERALDMFWLDIYGGGLWIPVGDRTNGASSYGGGRYLFDTAKGANLGISADGASIRLDFNFLYPPSCALNPAWVCPLCPPQNRLALPIEAGEMHDSAYQHQRSWAPVHAQAHSTGRFPLAGSVAL
jgi:uncharacterized protein (DUF1684 family)